MGEIDDGAAGPLRLAALGVVPAPSGGAVRHVGPMSHELRDGRLRALGVVEQPRALIAGDNENNLRMMTDRLQALGSWRPPARRRRTRSWSTCRCRSWTGLSATRRLRKDARLAHVPVVAVTALAAMPGDRGRGLAAGADGYLPKPARLRTPARVLEARVSRGRRGTGRIPRPGTPAS